MRFSIKPEVFRIFVKDRSSMEDRRAKRASLRQAHAGALWRCEIRLLIAALQTERFATARATIARNVGTRGAA